MVITLQDVIYLSWNLVSPVTYQAGQELECTISIKALEAGKYYLIGALYNSSTLEYITGTLFGVLLPEGSDYAVNSAPYASLWELAEGEEKVLPCKLTLNRTDAILGLFLMRMVGDAPSLDDDEQIGSLSTQLSSPTPPITLEAFVPWIVVCGMLGFMMSETLKE